MKSSLKAGTKRMKSAMKRMESLDRSVFAMQKAGAKALGYQMKKGLKHKPVGLINVVKKGLRGR